MLYAQYNYPKSCRIQKIIISTKFTTESKWANLKVGQLQTHLNKRVRAEEKTTILLNIKRLQLSHLSGVHL